MYETAREEYLKARYDGLCDLVGNFNCINYFIEHPEKEPNINPLLLIARAISIDVYLKYLKEEADEGDDDGLE